MVDPGLTYRFNHKFYQVTLGLPVFNLQLRRDLPRFNMFQPKVGV